MKKGCLIITGLLFFLIILSLFFALFSKSIPLRSKVALVRIEGPIFDSKNIVDELKEYMKHASVKAIILRIDSPGGAVAPSQEIYEEVKKAAGKKKIVVSMGSIAASGGYYIAAPSTKIIANPGTLTGSIGVILEIPNFQGLMTKIGVKTEVIKSGRHKDMVSYFRGIRKEEREILQGVMDNVHEQFIRAVSEGRNLGIEEVQQISDGRIFTGEQALQFGLIDELGTLEDAITVAAELAGIEGEPDVISKEEELSLIEMLRNKFPGNISDVFPTLRIKYLYVP